jgi:hypothetical protein
VPLPDVLDAAAVDLRADPDQTYEAAITVASAADQHAGLTSDEARVALSIRDAFGTWVQRIHSYGACGNLGDAEAAHRDIAAALEDWMTSGRNDPTAFAQRWGARVGAVDIAWMREGVTLVRRSRLGDIRRRFRWKRG